MPYDAYYAFIAVFSRGYGAGHDRFLKDTPMSVLCYLIVFARNPLDIFPLFANLTINTGKLDKQ